MTNLTKKEALKACVKGWNELAESGSPRKTSSSLTKYLNACPCCQYVKEVTNTSILDLPSTNCKLHCPMFSVWPRNCTQPRSLYKNWYTEEHNTVRRQYHAKKIAKAAQLLLYLEDPNE